MIRLFNIELQKLWKNRSSKVLTLTYFVLLTLISLIATINFDIGPIHVSVTGQTHLKKSVKSHLNRV